MDFYPPHAPVPEEKVTPRLVLRPLRAIHVELDFEAVMSSAEYLRLWSQSTWPADDFTLAENLEDLQRHEREHTERKAFTYTVLDLDGRRCLGCVYIQPLWPEAAQLCEQAVHAAAVGFWIRSSEASHDLNRHLLATLREWFDKDWAFDCVVYTYNPQDARQAALFAQAESRLPFNSPDGHAWMAAR